MRRLFLILSIALISLPLFASGSKEEDFVGVTIYSSDDAFINEVIYYMGKAAEGRVPLRVVSAESDQERQNQQVSDMIDQGAKVIIVNTVDRMASGLIIDKCRQSNVPLVFFNRQPAKDDMMKWEQVYYVGCPGGDGGIIVGNYFSSYWDEHPELDRNGDGILQFVLIIGEPGHQDTELRTEYLLRTLQENGMRLEKLDEVSGKWRRDNAKSVMSRYLSSYGDSIEAVFCNNDEMAIGAIDALKEQGWFQDGRFMPVTGVDGTPQGMAVLQEGTMLCTVLNDADGQARAAYELALELMGGKVPEGTVAGFDLEERYIWVPYRELSRESVSSSGSL